MAGATTLAKHGERRDLGRRVEAIKKDAKLYALKRAYAGAFDRAGEVDTAIKLRKCGEWEVLVCCQDCRSSWWVAYRCHLRCCPLCARDVARDRLRFLKAVTATQSQCKMLTLTMRRWHGDPRLGIKQLRDALQRFRDSKLMRTCTGGAYTIELVPKPDGWHIHAHLLINSGFLVFRRLLKVWAACLRQPSPHVRVQAATKDTIKAYVCKYATKTGMGSLGKDGAERTEKGIGPKDVVAWFAAVRGSRLWGSFGVWYRFDEADIAEVMGAFVHVSECPYCGGVRTVFQARAGPFIYGGDWCRFAGIFGNVNEDERLSRDENGNAIGDACLSVSA